MVAVSARLPSNACTISGNPIASVSRPIVIWASNRRSLDKPGSRNASAAHRRAKLQISDPRSGPHQKRGPSQEYETADTDAGTAIDATVSELANRMGI